MKKLKHVQLFETFTNEGMEGSRESLPPVDISNSSDVIAVYHGDGGPIIGLLSPSEAEQLENLYDMDKSSKYHLFADGDLDFQTKPGVAYVGMTLDQGFMAGTAPILAGPGYEAKTAHFFMKGGYGTDYGTLETWDPEADAELIDSSAIVTLKRGYLTIFGGPGTQGYGTDAKTLPFREALEKIKRSYGIGMD